MQPQARRSLPQSLQWQVCCSAWDCSSCHDAGELDGSHVARSPMRLARHRSRKVAIPHAAISGNFCEWRNSIAPQASPIWEPTKLKCPPRNDSPHHRITGVLMVITSAHIPAIVALIAGILILIMPRLLNFIVAIYLIVVGLIGLGLLHWIHV